MAVKRRPDLESNPRGVGARLLHSLPPPRSSLAQRLSPETDRRISHPGGGRSLQQPRPRSPPGAPAPSLVWLRLPHRVAGAGGGWRRGGFARGAPLRGPPAARAASGGRGCGVRGCGGARRGRRRGKVKVVPSVYDLGFFYFSSFPGTAEKEREREKRKEMKER